jgi:hypothetical protein
MNFDDLFDTPANHARILRIGYPTVRYYEPEGDSADGRIEWWNDDDEPSFDDAIDAIVERNPDADLSDEPEYRAYIEYENRILSETFAALARSHCVRDLCELIDAAAQSGGATCATNAAGAFLLRIAELAMERILQGGVNHG